MRVPGRAGPSLDRLVILTSPRTRATAPASASGAVVQKGETQ
jgi:hypothetical protein